MLSAASVPLYMDLSLLNLFDPLCVTTGQEDNVHLGKNLFPQQRPITAASDCEFSFHQVPKCSERCRNYSQKDYAYYLEQYTEQFIKAVAAHNCKIRTCDCNMKGGTADVKMLIDMRNELEKLY